MLSPTADFIDFFIRLPSTALTFSKKTPPTKTIRKPCVFNRFFAFRCLRAQFENHRKIASNALLKQVTPQRSLEAHYFRVSERQNRSRGLSRASWEASCGSSGTLLAANLTLLARRWALLGSFGAALGRSWLALGDASSRKFSKLRLPDRIFVV